MKLKLGKNIKFEKIAAKFLNTNVSILNSKSSVMKEAS